jgi:uncharacterized protein with GYD domain
VSKRSKKIPFHMLFLSFDTHIILGERRLKMLFVMLLSPKGRGTEAVKYLKELKAPPGITIHDVYFTLGRYDGVIVFKALDVKTAMIFAMETGFDTDYTAETLTAIPAKEL